MTSNLVAATIPSVLCFERGSSNASGGRREAGEPPDPRRVTRLDRMDGQSRDQVRPRLDQRSLALVGRHGQVLEGDGGTPERVGVLRGAAEVEARPLHRIRAEDLAKRLDVGPLVRADHARLLREAAGQDTEPLGLPVERLLDVLEREGVVEDRLVAALGRGLRRRGAHAEQRRPADHGAAQERRPRLAVQDGDRLLERAVPVELANGQIMAHLTYPDPFSVAATRSADAGGSDASGAGVTPAIARIQDACRASTETMRAAAASAPFVRFGAWAL